MGIAVGLLVVAAGVFSLCGAWFDWEWFMGGRKARLFVTLLGRKGARGFYAVLGLGLVVLGALMAAGVIPLETAVASGGR